MSGGQSPESREQIGRLDERVKGLQRQIDRRFDETDKDMAELKDDMKWVRRTMISLVVSMLVVAGSILLTAAVG